MTLLAKVQTHKISKNITLSAAGYNVIGADSPAIEAMTDFLRVSVVTVGPDASLVEANAQMIARGVRLLMVTSANDRLEGLITARDVLGEKPMQVASARGCKRDELKVAELMTPISQVDTLYLKEVLNVRVVDILDALKRLGRQHILVEDVDAVTGLPRVRGVFSATNIGRQLGVPVLGFELASTFAEIEAALAN
ncbi:MAG: CBS domain-containing protein [Gammaproteobacteria bacterium]|nr:CBS domain-containing protein [Gammaproteobacteria bacterium]MBU1603022.1 CBS domain-containing protein [Gammaproteobacteria bacterium]MBU2434114.1 CBS domain-containing protein [Gammaproteobacteria bacterium]MBU2448054.1 CBS domain-containing protein [Gammaproteobacteria bacterium]